VKRFALYKGVSTAVTSLAPG